MSAIETSRLRALVVDDESSVRKLIVASLIKEGFECVEASNGEVAARQVGERTFDAVITDLAMPVRHGHALAVEVLTRADRPLVVVLTGVAEPRLAKDLLARGVDDIVFKPVHFAAFAAKVRSLVNRRRAVKGAQLQAQAKRPAGAAATTISREEFEKKLARLARVPPMSQAAVEVFRLATEPQSDVQQVAVAARRDPALMTEILRLANSSFFNPVGAKVADLENAVSRLGLKRVGEIALTSAAFTSLRSESEPFFPLARVWRRCLAAGICLELLAEHCAGVNDSAGLFCAAVLQPIGRVILASLFPQTYSKLISAATEKGRTLSELESLVFPETTGEVAARLLAGWGIPDDIHRPLKHTSASYAALAGLPDTIRRRVELVKLAGFLGDLAAGQFEDWDLLDFPPPTVTRRLSLNSVDSILSQCREDLANIVAPQSDGQEKTPAEPKKPVRTLAYKRLGGEEIDFVPHLCAAAGIRVVNVSDDLPDLEEPMLISAIYANASHVIARTRSLSTHNAIILTDVANAERLQDKGKIVTVPTSYQVFRENCHC